MKSTLQQIQEQDLNQPFPYRMPEQTAPHTASSPATGAAAANQEFFDPAAEHGGRYVTVTAADSGNLNYLLNNDSAVSSFWDLTTCSLAERNWERLDEFQPLLAESWSISEDRMSYRIKLRKGILWHDFVDPVTGKEWKNVEVTSRDFQFYLQVIKDEKVDAAALRGYFAGIQEIRIINDYEFDVVWHKKYFLSKEITLGLIPLPRHLYHAYEGPFDGSRFNDDHERNRMIVGCGPYQFDSWEKGKYIKFKRFEKYFGKSLGIMPPIRQIVFELIQHPSTRLQALVSQDVDKINLTPEQWITHTRQPAFGEQGYLRKLQTLSSAYNYIGMNLTNPLFQDRNVRVALSHLVDRDRIVKDIYYGLANPVSGPLFSGSPFYDSSIKPYEFNVELAKKMLAEAGWQDSDNDGVLDKDGKVFRFTLIYPNVNTIFQKLLPILKEDMAKAGIQLDILALEWSVILERIDSRNFDAAALGWVSPIMPDPYQLWHSDSAKQENSSNYISFSNPEADRLIEEIRQCFDPDKLLQLYHQFHALIHQEEPYLFLFSASSLNAINKRYRNLREFPLGFSERILWVPKSEQLPAGY